CSTASFISSSDTPSDSRSRKSVSRAFRAFGSSRSSSSPASSKRDVRLASVMSLFDHVHRDPCMTLTDNVVVVTDPSRVKPVVGALTQIGGVDRVIGALAERQHGVVARSQLLDAGIGRRAIGHRIEQKRLHIAHRGVYAVGHRRLTRAGRWIAAALAGGPGAVLNHRAAGALWGLRPSEHRDVTVPSYRKRR